MASLEQIDEFDGPVEEVCLALPLDRATIRWLAKMTTSDVEAAEFIASMLREIRADDEAAHATKH